MENLTKVLAEVNNTYGKNTLVAETSYAYTLDDGDGQDNVIRFDYQTVDGGYEASVQGQANKLRDVIDAANRARALGVFYWEPAWIPVSRATREINLPIWEKYGSGWASSYAISYDPNVTVNNYGGSEWDNQALFNFDGYALPTLKVFEFVEEGYGEAPTNLFINGGFEEEDFSLFYISAEYVTRTNDTPYAGENALHFWSNQNIDFIVEQKVNLLPGEYEFMVYMQGDENGESENIYTYIKYDNTLMRSESITLDGYENWKIAKIVFSIDYEKTITFGINVQGDPGGWGTIDEWTLRKVKSNEYTKYNLIINGSFEEDNIENYTISKEYVERWQDSPLDGNYSLHFWSDNQVDFFVEQELELDPGLYEFEISIQGDSLGVSEEVFSYVKTKNLLINSESISLVGYAVWKKQKLLFSIDQRKNVTIGLYVRGDGGAWGTTDNWKLYKI